MLGIFSRLRRSGSDDLMMHQFYRVQSTTSIPWTRGVSHPLVIMCLKSFLVSPFSFCSMLSLSCLLMFSALVATTFSHWELAKVFDWFLIQQHALWLVWTIPAAGLCGNRLAIALICSLAKTLLDKETYECVWYVHLIDLYKEPDIIPVVNQWDQLGQRTWSPSCQASISDLKKYNNEIYDIL